MKKITSPLLLSALFFFCAFCFNKTRIGIITDTHVGDTKMRSLYLKNVLEKLAEDNVTKVFHLGDLTNTGVEEEYTEIISVFEEFKNNITLFPLIGNHDARTDRSGEIFGKMMSSRIKNFKERIMDYSGTNQSDAQIIAYPNTIVSGYFQNYVILIEGVMFICLDWIKREPLEWVEGAVNNVSLAFLESVLKKVELDPSICNTIVLLQHHPLVYLGLHTSFPLGDFSQILNTIDKFSTKVVNKIFGSFAGHTHVYNYDQIDNGMNYSKNRFQNIVCASVKSFSDFLEIDLEDGQIKDFSQKNSRRYNVFTIIPEIFLYFFYFFSTLYFLFFKSNKFYLSNLIFSNLYSIGTNFAMVVFLHVVMEQSNLIEIFDGIRAQPLAVIFAYSMYFLSAPILTNFLFFSVDFSNDFSIQNLFFFSTWDALTISLNCLLIYPLISTEKFDFIVFQEHAFSNYEFFGGIFSVFLFVFSFFLAFFYSFFFRLLNFLTKFLFLLRNCSKKEKILKFNKILESLKEMNLLMDGSNNNTYNSTNNDLNLIENSENITVFTRFLCFEMFLTKMKKYFFLQIQKKLIILSVLQVLAPFFSISLAALCFSFFMLFFFIFRESEIFVFVIFILILCFCCLVLVFKLLFMVKNSQIVKIFDAKKGNFMFETFFVFIFLSFFVCLNVYFDFCSGVDLSVFFYNFCLIFLEFFSFLIILLVRVYFLFFRRSNNNQSTSQNSVTPTSETAIN